MKTLFLTAAAVVLSFSLTGSARADGQAAPGKSVTASANRGHSGGRSFSFHGHHAYRHGHNFWNQRRWFSNYGCYGYYCPQQCCWYYNYNQGSCYLPMSCYQSYPCNYGYQNYNAAPIAPNAPPVANVAPNVAPPVKPIKPVKPY